ncbi:MAG: DUF4124 domain-containing protein [Proteobacteria bacterium]|nr:DUF4124 domain-containing protein [Pseudomonadota bacterium]
MLKKTIRYLFIGLMTTCSLFTTAATEIYKWVDADGNVHFGDKPYDPGQANKAKPVELTTGYQPQARTAAQQEAFEREQRSIIEKSKASRDFVEQRQQKDFEEAQAKSRQKNVEDCTAYEREIKRLSGTEIVNGRRRGTYLTGEDGKSLTAKRQREIVDELMTEMAKRGC